MRLVSVDFETACTTPGLLAPPATCLAVAGDGPSRLHHVSEGPAVLERLLIEHDVIVLGHNFAAFAAAVALYEWPEIAEALFLAFAEGRVSDTMIREQLLDIAAGMLGYYEVSPATPDTEAVNKRKSYSLEALSVARGLGPPWKSEWRLRYSELRDVPLARWPAEAARYPVEDAERTLTLWQAQAADDPAGVILFDELRQVRAAFALHLSSCLGFYVDPDRLARLSADACAAITELAPRLEAAGLIRANGTRAIKYARARVVAKVGEAGARRTPKGQVSVAKRAIAEYGDEVLDDYALLAEWRAVLDKDVPAFSKWTAVQTRYGLAKTGRSTSSAPNLQNLRRLPGVRECLAARPGRVLLVADLSIGELRAWAQICLWWFGYSMMADAIEHGVDLHAALGADIMRVSYEDMLAGLEVGDDVCGTYRQLSKSANFGFPGGMGVRKFVESCWKYGHEISEADAHQIRQAWLTRWHEAGSYFAAIASSGEGPAMVEHPVSHRLRGKAYYTERCNGYFQGLVADLAKDVCWRLALASWAGDGALRHAGARLVAFNHDEWVLEVPDDVEVANACAAELVEIVAEAGRVWTPDVLPVARPLLTRRWSKKALELRDDRERLRSWDDR